MMPGVPTQRADVECRSPAGRVLASVQIVSSATTQQPGLPHPLILLSEEEARSHGEERVQLRERGRYEYLLIPSNPDDDLILLEGRGITRRRLEKEHDSGLIEPQDHCGLLPLVVVRRGDATLQPLATGAVEVRSLKLGFREHYRGMLSFIAEKCAGLLLDCRAPTRLRLDSLWKENAAVLEQQLEFLRHTLESQSFRSAVDQILLNPHRRLEPEPKERDIHRPFKSGKDFARRIASATRRVTVPSTHPLYSRITSLPASVTVQQRQDFLDTAENRFVKLVLTEFRDFLAGVASHLGRKLLDAERAEERRLLVETGRLRGLLETQLARGFFPDISHPTFLPLGSPVLQRKAGYRELFRFWLQFHASARLVWDGSTDVFHAGARNVATLYEYWLFFQLESLFHRKFDCDQPLHAILINKEKIPPQLELKRGVQLKTPVSGVWSQKAGRRLQAEFQFNRKFARNDDHTRGGSWTRGVQPDYTISIWPADYAKDEAEKNELMVHIHFDAKYRVEQINELLGDDNDDSVFVQSEPASAAKYQDLLKMHAYRDAVRRTAGAYVLYPGNPVGGNKQFRGFHEVIPGLGAFAVRPDKDGRAAGLDAVSDFLDSVIEHLANRTTARERVSYHVSESYRVKENPVPYGALLLPEADIYGQEFRALPPSEEMVLVAWYETPAQCELAFRPEGFVFVRLGLRAGALHVHPNFARTRRVLLRTHNAVVAPGILRLREPGYRVYTRLQLRNKLNDEVGASGVRTWQETAGADDEENIYALFETTPDDSLGDLKWDGNRIMDEIEKFETDSRNKLVVNVGRTSPYPRVLPLREILKARVATDG